jgi:hypothetical protein
VVAVRFNVLPEQTGPLLPAVGVDVELTVAAVVAAADVQPLTVAVTV